jgi:hypothetical protein
MTLQVHPRTRMALKELSKDSQDHPGAVRVHPTTKEDPHRIIQELSGSSQGPGMTLQNHPRPVRVYSTTRDDPPGLFIQGPGWPSKIYPRTLRIIQELSGFIQQPGRTLTGSSKNCQDHPTTSH